MALWHALMLWRIINQSNTLEPGNVPSPWRRLTSASLEVLISGLPRGDSCWATVRLLVNARVNRAILVHPARRHNGQPYLSFITQHTRRRWFSLAAPNLIFKTEHLVMKYRWKARKIDSTQGKYIVFVSPLITVSLKGLHGPHCTTQCVFLFVVTLFQFCYCQPALSMAVLQQATLYPALHILPAVPWIGPGGRATVTRRLLVWVSRCPWARCLTLTAPDKLAVAVWLTPPSVCVWM